MNPTRESSDWDSAPDHTPLKGESQQKDRRRSNRPPSELSLQSEFSDRVKELWDEEEEGGENRPENVPPPRRPSLRAEAE
eukprot:CAMPEP_0118944458 /NCGR_PEP_ID=MMETSP1169-20130426/40358_1 /TAXON_ID=36882 /ORGANISM="Pyramimonas obovata, Strain CCMP722" /LENGTH=79 /DNA_ID=CAMNT_0006889955 /DNA_START=82 /DNA_END=318 /DNA_ORIENTATION=+